MKKLSLIIITASAIALAGCSNGKVDKVKSDIAKLRNSSTPEAVYKASANDLINKAMACGVGDNKAQQKGVKEDDYYKAHPDCEYIVEHIKSVNPTPEYSTAGMTYFKEQLTQRMYDYKYGSQQTRVTL
jgi:hypothetical protein